MSDSLKTALYLRYSDKEDSKTESSSIDNQRKMLHHYIEGFAELEFTEEYVDDDYTGTNFNRPGFKKLKRDCQDGKIQCIVVKDHSRFARKSSRMQIILEDDLADVRYISKDDNFDSRYDDYDVIFQIKNLFNEMYAQDISRKVHSSINDKQRRGSFIGAFAPYGYQKNPENKNELLIDEEAAEVVRSIYNMRLKGMNVASIAKTLNDMFITSPYEYKLRNGSNFYSPKARKTNGRHLWDFTSVNKILRMQTYAGDLEQGRQRQKMRGKPKMQKKEDWIIAAGCAPAIISREDFDRVQFLLNNAKHFALKGKGEPHIFAGVLYCGECGKAMVKSVKNDEALYYACGTRKRNGKSICDLEYIRYDVLEKVILEDLNSMIISVNDFRSLIQTDIGSLNFSDGKSQLDKCTREKEALQFKRRKYYTDYADGLITKEDYLFFKEESERREQAISKKIDELEQGLTKKKQLVNPWLDRFFELGEVESLDRIIVQEMISSIRIFKGRKIEITYKFHDFQEEINTYKDSCAN
ncbi:MAG: recombinase family protein [Lacrimispora sp.]|uniref:recombinase family protein n=1 Tax=Lacrimispora sp. TaxID=2719234 RepID=UPI0039E487F5